jgi:hypothetical protein
VLSGILHRINNLSISFPPVLHGSETPKAKGSSSKSGHQFRDNAPMLIVAIAWIYVVLMMSLTETSFVAGLATFVFYGLLPLSIVLYLLGTPGRWRRRRQREVAAIETPDDLSSQKETEEEVSIENTGRSASPKPPGSPPA